MQLTLLDGANVYSLNEYIHIGNDGLGLPPVSIIEQSGPLQDGAQYQSTRLQPRTIRLVLLLSASSVDDYWQRRAALNQLFRPGRRYSLQISLPDGKRNIDVIYAGGLSLSSSDKQGLSHKIAVELRAADPVWYDPTMVAIPFGSSISQNPLVVPFTVPVFVGASTLDETITISYNGTWKSHPVIVIDGPISDPRIDHLGTNAKLQLSLNLLPNQSVTIDTRYGYSSVTSQNGQSLLSTLSVDSDLTAFALLPHPDVANGQNKLRVRGTSVTAQTRITIQYYNRYIGV